MIVPLETISEVETELVYLIRRSSVVLDQFASLEDLIDSLKGEKMIHELEMKPAKSIGSFSRSSDDGDYFDVVTLAGDPNERAI